MSDLVEFLLARIAEDEAVARGVQARVDAHGHPEYYEHAMGSSADVYWDTDYRQGGYTVSAARVLAECEAKRRIIDEHLCPRPDPACTDCGACSGRHHADPTPAPCATIRALALPYVDCPDYDQAWAL